MALLIYRGGDEAGQQPDLRDRSGDVTEAAERGGCCFNSIIATAERLAWLRTEIR